MAYTELQSGRVFYQMMSSQSGARGSLLFLHGAGGSSKKWTRLLDAGMNGWNMVALDLPGHGESSGNPLEQISAYAGTIKEFLEVSALPRPLVIAGHSMGASISLLTALKYPDIVDGLVLIGAGARMSVNKQMLEQLAQGTFDTGFLKISYGPDTPAELLQSELEQIAKVPQRYLYIDFNACDSFDVSEQLGSLAIPVLILIGDKDKMTPLRNSEFLNTNIADSVLKVIPGSGHNLMLEKPQETKLAIQEFLNEKLA